MFLRKLLSDSNKITWVFIDLLVVIIGVYTAFLIQSYAQEQRVEKEKERIYSALKYELENFRIFLPGRSSYTSGRVNEWTESYKEGKYINFSNWIFIEPQYTYQIIEYAMSIEDNEIVDFQLYNRLQKLYVEIKKLEHAEQLIMERSLKYKSINDKLSVNQSEERKLDNMDNFKMFIRFSESRASTLMQVAKWSGEALVILNQRIGPTKRKELERELIKSKVNSLGPKEEAIKAVKQHFPDFSEEELKDLFEEGGSE